jgi:hypothetical protein
MNDAEFDKALADSIDEIYQASTVKIAAWGDTRLRWSAVRSLAPGPLRPPSRRFVTGN